MGIVQFISNSLKWHQIVLGLSATTKIFNGSDGQEILARICDYLVAQHARAFACGRWFET